MSLAARAEALWWRQHGPGGGAGGEAAAAGLWLWPLTLASLGYRLGAAVHRVVARPVRASVPVISVGNLAVGGTGKTPVAAFLCARLLERGHRPALLSRGHGRSSREPLRVSPDTPVQLCGDEPLLLARRIPALAVWVGPDRVALARLAVEQGADVLVLDDGLQHHRLARDLDLVVLDAQNPVGNGRFLPRGPLREDGAAFDRIGARGLVWLTRAGSGRSPALAPLLARARRAGLPGVLESTLVPAADASWSGQRVLLLTGIARPGRVLDTLTALGAQVAEVANFPDHHAFTPRELAVVQARARQAGVARIATTEKDFVRLPPAPPESSAIAIAPLRVDVEVTAGLELLDQALDSLLGLPGQPRT